MSKILLTGASGKTGEAIYKLLTTEGKHELIALSSQKEKFPRKDNIFSLNMTDKKELKSFLHEHKPEVIINAAAYTDVDGSEDNKKAAMDLNATLVGNLANFCKINESHLITFSTDYIFDGKLGPYTEDALPRPLSYYGKTKLAGENAAKIELSSYTIIRTNIVYGYSSFGKNDFIRWVAGNLKEGKELNIIEGQWGNPTLTDDLAEAVKKILGKKKHGTYNIAGKDWLNRYELALKVADVFGYERDLIRPLDPKALKQKAKRPEKGGLITLKAETDLNIKSTSLDNGLTTLKHQLNSPDKSNLIKGKTWH